MQPQIKLKPKEQFDFWKQEIGLCENVRDIPNSEVSYQTFITERARLTKEGLAFIKRGFYAPAVAKELERLY